MTQLPDPPIARWLGCQRIELEPCASTNDEAARLARAGARHGTVVIAERRRAAAAATVACGNRRRAGSTCRPCCGRRCRSLDVPPMTLAIGIGVCDAVARGRRRAPSLKWPNDVLVGGRKLAGVLVEAQSQGGRLETRDRRHRRQPHRRAARVARRARDHARARRRHDRSIARRSSQVLLAQRRALGRSLRRVGLEAIIPAWQERMALGLVARATIDGAPLVGASPGSIDDGALLLRDDDGTLHRVRSGDVEVIRPTAAAD